MSFGEGEISRNYLVLRRKSMSRREYEVTSGQPLVVLASKEQTYMYQRVPVLPVLVCLQKGTILRRPFFFFFLLEETSASSASSCCLLLEAVSPVLSVVAEAAGCAAAPFGISFTCCGGGSGCPPSGTTFGLSSFGSGATLGLSSPAAGTGPAELSEAGAAELAGGAAPVLFAGAALGSAVALESAGGGASERGTASPAGGAPVPTVSMETLFLSAALREGAINARLASWTTSVALTGLGSTRVGWPTLVACATSGCFLKLLIMRPNIPLSWRLASSALFCATAALVGLGTG